MAQLIIRHAQSKPALTAQQRHPKAVTTIREYLAVHYADSISLEQLAQLVNLSPFHTLRMFRQATGLPPHGYLVQLRINQAKQLLHTQLPLAEVAVQTGFSDQSHLNRHFKRVLGVTPLQYRRQA
ncbi:AraC family transcriptional regulator [Herpetosiphon gulosus]|uniref:Arabinose operon regulatory protein n=1 Tax=Herpetosiphon gulosus TaxID=1973496 RepID=A0ABP9WTT0_9CHLR